MNIVKYMLFSSVKTNNWDKKNLVHSICFFSFGSYIFVSYIFLLSLGVWNHESQTRWPTSTLALLPSNYRNEYYFKLNTPFIGITRMKMLQKKLNMNLSNWLWFLLSLEINAVKPVLPIRPRNSTVYHAKVQINEIVNTVWIQQSSSFSSRFYCLKFYLKERNCYEMNSPWVISG